MISETLILFIFIAMWIITFVLMWAIKESFIPGIGGVIGVMLGIRLMESVDTLLGLVVVFIGFYQLYVAAFAEGKRR